MNNVAGNIEGQNMCEDVKKMFLQLPDATEEQVHKYLQKEYSMTDDEIEGLKKICKLGADNSKGKMCARMSRKCFYNSQMLPRSKCTNIYKRNIL